MAAAGTMIERRELVEALLRARGVTIVHGESGAGKTTLLSEACEEATRGRFVAGPAQLGWSDELISHLLEAMGELVGQIVEEQGAARRVGERINGSLQRLVADQGRALISAAWKEVLAAARSRISPEAGQALAEAVAAFREEEGDSLAARLEREQSRRQRKIVAEFATEVVALAEGREVVVALDRGERLKEDGMRLLADLTEELPNGFHLWVAMKDTDQTATLRQISAAV